MRVPVPVLETVTVCAGDVVPSVTEPKARVVGDTVTTGVPVPPVKVTVIALDVEAG